MSSVAKSVVLLLLSAGCGHKVCDSDAECPADFECQEEIRTCIKKTTPSQRPNECGDRCEIGALRCAYAPTSVTVESCDLGEDGCSHWTQGVSCNGREYCRDEQGCLPQASEGSPCSEPIECAGDLRCEFFDSEQGHCVRGCSTGANCEANEICAFQVCMPASSCDGCEEGAYECSGSSVRRCARVNGECLRFEPVEICQGTNVCEGGACVGTVPSGGTCSVINACQTGLVCPSDTQVCMSVCQTSGECASPNRCHILATTAGRAICANSAVPTVETQCTVHFGAFHVDGDWDNPLIGATNTPDPYAVIEAPGQPTFVTGRFDEVRDANFDATSPPFSFGSFYDARVTLYDYDDIFSGADIVAAWALSDQYPWDDGGRHWEVTLSSGAHTLAVTIDCGGG